MPTAVSEQIMQKVATRLATITVVGGYEVTVSEVVRPTRYGGFRPQHLQLVVTQGGLTKNEVLSAPGNPPKTAWDMEIVIAGLLMPLETATDKIDALRMQFSSDVIKAICTPTASWHNWDTLAIDTQIGSVDDVTTEEASGFKTSITVTFRTDENNPYQSRT